MWHAIINKNIEEEVRMRRFRHDLYYRLNVCRINIPLNGISNLKTNYLDIGYHYGVEWPNLLTKLLSLGVDYRGTIASGEPNMKATYSTIGGYVGINF